MNDPLTDIILLEQIAANSLPPLYFRLYSGWCLRYSFGVTRRANSVLANAWSGEEGLEPALAHVEDFYRQWNAPPRFQVSPATQPEGLIPLLASRGYTEVSGADVQTGTPERVLAQSRDTHPLVVTPGLTDDWFEVYAAVDDPDGKKRTVRRNMLERLPSPAAFVLVSIEGQPAGVGLGVLERDLVGVFNMATLPSFRRQGVASATMRGLAAWGEARGARGMYLQVSPQNAAAGATYERLGFSTRYRYNYWERPLA